MDKNKYLNPESIAKLDNMSLRARLVVEGYLLGQHKSPYHGFSVEFAEHRSYGHGDEIRHICLLYTSPSPRDRTRSRMPSSA